LSAMTVASFLRLGQTPQPRAMSDQVAHAAGANPTTQTVML
jgi:hypothetical protein